MKPTPSYSLAYSSCPNDTFIFKAIAKALIPMGNLGFSISLGDVETLNQQAARGIHQVTKLSFAALGNLLNDYALLRAGAALGRGCGPLVISLPEKELDPAHAHPVVAVPGMGTTAYHLFRFYLADRFPGIQPRIKAMPFETIMPAVARGEADFGVIIHEGRFVYADQGMALQQDLGQWWEEKTGHPIPLGCIAVHRSMEKETALAIEALIGQSIDHAFAHPKAGEEHIRDHAQELAPEVIRQHIALYVNDFSRELGEEGEAAVQTFFEHSIRAGLMESPSQPLFIG